MNVDRKEAKELIDGYFETYPQIKEYMDKSIDLARGQGYIETIFGRKRYLPDINSRIRLCADMPNGMPSMLLSKEVQPILSR